MMPSQKISSHRVMGRTIRKDNFHHSQKLEPCRREISTSSRTSEGSKPPGSPVGPTEGPTSSPHTQHESSYNLFNQWDPREKSLLPQLFRKGTASKITYFLWIQSEYNLSCMLSKHWEFLKILQVIQKLLIL